MTSNHFSVSKMLAENAEELTLLGERHHPSLEIVQLFSCVLWIIEPEALADPRRRNRLAPQAHEMKAITASKAVQPPSWMGFKSLWFDFDAIV